MVSVAFKLYTTVFDVLTSLPESDYYKVVAEIETSLRQSVIFDPITRTMKVHENDAESFTHVCISVASMQVAVLIAEFAACVVDHNALFEVIDCDDRNEDDLELESNVSNTAMHKVHPDIQEFLHHYGIQNGVDLFMKRYSSIAVHSGTADPFASNRTSKSEAYLSMIGFDGDIGTAVSTGASMQAYGLDVTHLKQVGDEDPSGYGNSFCFNVPRLYFHAFGEKAGNFSVRSVIQHGFDNYVDLIDEPAGTPDILSDEDSAFITALASDPASEEVDLTAMQDTDETAINTEVEATADIPSEEAVAEEAAPEGAADATPDVSGDDGEHNVGDAEVVPADAHATETVGDVGVQPVVTEPVAITIEPHLMQEPPRLWGSQQH